MRSLAPSLAALMILSHPCLAARAASELPLTLTITGPQSVTVGDEITIAVVLKNISPQKIAVSSGGPYIPIIHDEHGKVPPLKPGLWLRAGSAGLAWLEPEMSFTDYAAPLRQYELSPGKYIVKVKRPLDSPDYPKDTMLESNEITITVLPKKP